MAISYLATKVSLGQLAPSEVLKKLVMEIRSNKTGVDDLVELCDILEACQNSAEKTEEECARLNGGFGDGW